MCPPYTTLIEEIKASNPGQRQLLKLKCCTSQHIRTQSPSKMVEKVIEYE